MYNDLVGTESNAQGKVTAWLHCFSLYSTAKQGQDWSVCGWETLQENSGTAGSNDDDSVSS